MCSLCARCIPHSGQPTSSSCSNSASAESGFIAPIFFNVRSPFLAHSRAARIWRSTPPAALVTCATAILSMLSSSTGIHLPYSSILDALRACSCPINLDTSDTTAFLSCNRTHLASAAGTSTASGGGRSAASFALWSTRSFHWLLASLPSVWARTQVTSTSWPASRRAFTCAMVSLQIHLHDRRIQFLDVILLRRSNVLLHPSESDRISTGMSSPNADRRTPCCIPVDSAVETPGHDVPVIPRAALSTSASGMSSIGGGIASDAFTAAHPTLAGVKSGFIEPSVYHNAEPESEAGGSTGRQLSGYQVIP